MAAKSTKNGPRRIAILDLPQAEARELLRAGTPVHLPVNPVEYHGPHLSLHTDRLVTQGYLPELHAAVYGSRQPLLVADDLEVGVEPCPGPGSRHTAYKTAQKLVEEAVRALIELGATKIVLPTFHASPLHNRMLDEAITFARARGARAVAPLHAVLRAWIEVEATERWASTVSHVEDPAVRAKLLADLRHDFHAGFFETSVALHYVPASVSELHRKLPACPDVVPDARLAVLRRLAARFGRDAFARELEFAAAAAAWNGQRPFHGYTSQPAYATAEAGAVFAERMVRAMATLVRQVLEDGAEPPSAPLQWLADLTLEGRIPTSTATLADVRQFDRTGAPI